MDNDFSVDFAELARAVRSNDVITLRFVSVPQRLLLDFRQTDLDGPEVFVVDPAGSLRKRYESLARLRPRLEQPPQIVLVLWPGYARSLEDSPVWAAVLERLEASEEAGAIARAQKALRTLVQKESEYQKQAVLGEGFSTLWSAPPARP